MKYITSCPKCDTQFLLNDELVKAHHGKVQCGTCELVFNAKTRLTEVADDIHSPDEYQASLEEAAANDVPHDDVHHVEISSPFDSAADEFENVQVDPDPNFEISTPSVAAASNAASDDYQPSIFDDLNNNAASPKPKTKHPFWLGLLGLLLVLLAATQAIYHLRVKIAAEYPQFKPLLVQACSHLKCTVDLPKNLDLITIGDSDMQENDNFESVINFTSSLTNTANYPQTYPNIALTLTDESDQVVIKKLIQPVDYLPESKKVNDGIAGRSVSNVKLEIYVHEAVVAGYRILLVYP